ncbi:MAG: cbb3-type cytochrome c oxidase subunit 3 [Gemmatimonadaceae bacterium]|nr:cbb3-type cytochrome c oxidase subunit 3 [Gemmatimonadaceae bacterium]MCW5827263.1 cbb3-type cytochrome c oxidase subunit 3 [Gemmatimonadaceae bacterium]
MKLTDVMSASGLSMYAIVALLLFVAAFVMVVAMILAPGSAERMRAAAQLPLDDDTRSPGTGSSNG